MRHPTPPPSPRWLKTASEFSAAVGTNRAAAAILGISATRFACYIHGSDEIPEHHRPVVERWAEANGYKVSRRLFYFDDGSGGTRRARRRMRAYHEGFHDGCAYCAGILDLFVEAGSSS